MRSDAPGEFPGLTWLGRGLLDMHILRVAMLGASRRTRSAAHPGHCCRSGVALPTFERIPPRPAALPDSFHQQSQVRWFVCGLLFLATTVNYMDRSVFSLIEPTLHTLPFMGWNPGDPTHKVFNDNFGDVLICFQIAYGVGLLVSGRIIDKVGTKVGYTLAILVWALASLSHALVSSVAGFCIARFVLGLGESGNFPAALKATSEWFPQKQRALATGIWNSGANVSSIVAPLLIPFVVARFGWQAAFLTTGSLALTWLVLWLLFPYNKLRRRDTISQQELELPLRNAGLPPQSAPLGYILSSRGTWAFSIGKFLTDPIWWFYLFWLPKYFHENYGLALNQLYKPLIVVYLASSVGSIAAGYLAGALMTAGLSVDKARKLTMLVCALCVLPVATVPWLAARHAGLWPTIALFALAAAAHQGWSANLMTTPSDMLPSTSVSTVVGIGGACGAAGGAIFTAVVKENITTHPTILFLFAAVAYLLALLVLQVLVPQLGRPSPQLAADADLLP